MEYLRIPRHLIAGWLDVMRACASPKLLPAFILILATHLSAQPGLAQTGCTFRLGFKQVQDLIPDVVGGCLDDERHNPENGDGLQLATRGLLVWRKADNWTAFTNGSRTWINGPSGLQVRQNDERFPWEADARSIPIQVFFSRHPESDSDFTAVFPVTRTASDSGVASATLEALIAGPTAAESAAGYFSEPAAMLKGLSTCGGPDFKLVVEGDLATLRFCRGLVSAGVGQDARVRAQIEASLRQFPTIQRVRLLSVDGHCLFDMSGQDLCLR